MDSKGKKDQAGPSVKKDQLAIHIDILAILSHFAKYMI
jgi:hypothetical protein